MKKMRILYVILFVLAIAIYASGCGPSMSATTPSPALDAISKTVAAEAAATASVSVASSTPTQTSTITPIATTTPTAIAAATETPLQRVTVAKYFNTVDVKGKKWELPLGTYFAHTIKNNRYEAIQSLPVGDNNGWCGKGQLDCPPHVGLYYVEASSGLKPQMDIATRIMTGIATSSEDEINFQWMPYQDVLRGKDETTKVAMDYAVAATQGDLALFISVKDSSMQPAEITYVDKKYQVGYACWDCLAHTIGPNDTIVMTDNSQVSQFGTPTAPLGSSLYPGVIIPVPNPITDPTGFANFKIDIHGKIPQGTELVFWFGRYDVPLSATPTSTPTVTP